MTIKRFDAGYYGDPAIIEDKDGDYVLFTDHESALTSLRQELEAMKAENVRLRDREAGYEGELNQACDERTDQWRRAESAEASLQIANLNAARYEWLRKSDWYIGPDTVSTSCGCAEEGYDSKNYFDAKLNSLLDSAIDEAIQSTGERK